MEFVLFLRFMVNCEKIMVKNSNNYLYYHLKNLLNFRKMFTDENY